MRGGPVRSSLHTLTSNNNTSTPTRRIIEKPAAPQPPQPKDKVATTTDVASVVNLGGAGSRRTVYLDEALIKADAVVANRSPSNSINLGQQKPAVSGTATSSVSGATGSVPGSMTTTTSATNGGSSSSTAGGGDGPTTLLMYNRISNIISPLTGEGVDNQQQGSDKFGSSSSQNSNSNNNNNKGSLEDKEKESAIWYEYGCV